MTAWAWAAVGTGGYLAFIGLVLAAGRGWRNHRDRHDPDTLPDWLHSLHTDPDQQEGPIR